jgi:putative glycosyltransferase
MQLSIVTTMYRSAPYLREFHARVSAAAGSLTDDYEILFVNDGSPDEALDVALQLQAGDQRVRIVDLSRNFGHHQAMWTGLQQARGDQVFLIDCDLEEDPAWLKLFAERRAATGADVVYGVQERRGGSCLERWSGQVAYKLFNALSDDQLPENLLTVRLMSRRYLDALLRHTEVTFTIAGLWARTGFLQVSVPLHKGRRDKPTYSVFLRARVLVHAITAFSDRPLLYVFYLGLVILLGAALVSAALLARQLFFGALLGGWPSLMLSIWFLGGVIIFCQGILGAYLARVYREVKHRPISLIREIHENPASEKRKDPPGSAKAA